MIRFQMHFKDKTSIIYVWIKRGEKKKEVKDDSELEEPKVWGTWVAQSVKHPTLAQVMISRFVSSSPTSGIVLTAWSLKPASDSVSHSLSASAHALSLSLSKINKH